MEANIFPSVVADIGGTNARFGIVDGSKDEHGRLDVAQQKTFRCAEYKSFEDVFSEYLSSLNGTAPKNACIAIAGPVAGSSMKMTNLDWTVCSKSLGQTFALKNVKLINDFGALAYASMLLKDHEIEVIYSGVDNHEINTEANRVVMGPGTGLGIAGLIRTGNCWHPVCGEGGHVSFAALDNHQAAIRSALLSLSTDEPHLSLENLLSGQGLVNLYKANCMINGVDIEDKTPSEVSKEASNKTNDQSVQAVHDFTHILGASLGDTALTLGAFGGVFLCGGILPKIVDLIDKDVLVEAFVNKGVQRKLVEAIPIYLVSAPMPALVGAAHWLNDSQ